MRNILFLCTGNSARSILAEAIAGRVGEGRLLAFSAGSKPAGLPNPHAITLLQSLGYDTSGFRSKNWDEFAGADGPSMDIIVTVCDSAAGEACPVWPGHPVAAHWGLPDPAGRTGDDKQMRSVFLETYALLSDRIGRLVSLPFETMESSELVAALRTIGRLPGATPKTVHENND